MLHAAIETTTHDENNIHNNNMSSINHDKHENNQILLKIDIFEEKKMFIYAPKVGRKNRPRWNVIQWGKHAEHQHSTSINSDVEINNNMLWFCRKMISTKGVVW